MNPRALRILGQLAEHHSDTKRADALMQAGADLSMHASAAVYWTMMRRYRAGDYKGTLRYADILLRTRSQVQPYVLPLVAALAETPAASDQVKTMLAENPPWRSRFFAYLPNGVSDARTPLELLLSVKGTKTPPSMEDLRSYLDFLVQRNFYELAYYAWLQFLPPEQLARVGRLFNGDFEMPLSGLPFDWRFKGGSGVTMEVTDRPDYEGGKALLLEFGPGRVELGGVSQIVLLPPGRYQLEGKYKSDLVSQRGLQWRISCGDKLIGESRPVMGTKPVWSDFALRFTVPEGCIAQTIKLVLDARYASETFVSGFIWYDNLKIGDAPETDETTTDGL